MTRQALEKHFAVGNVILSNYWRNHDRVIAFDWNNGDWRVWVIACTPDGSELPDAYRRLHATTPSPRDRIIVRGA